jgi:hypothetical protein
LVCGTPDIAVHQCTLSLEKWFELIVGTRQIILGLVVDTIKMTVSITDEYIERVQELLKLREPDQRFFKINNMQKLIGELTRLGEGAPWVFKLMSHLYRSLAFALKSNTKILKKSSSGFRDSSRKSQLRPFWRSSLTINVTLFFAMKKAAKMVSKHGSLPCQLNYAGRAKFYLARPVTQLWNQV